MNALSLSSMTYHKRGTGAEKPFSESILVQLLIIICLLVSLGFPGSLTEVIGNKIGKMIEYIGFGIEILVILLSSASNWKEIELLHLEKKFSVMYAYVIFIFIESMLVTIYPKEQFISCMRLVVTLLFAIWLVQHCPLEKVISFIAYAQGVFILITVFFMIRYPGMAYESSSHFTNAFTGLYNTKNACASELVFGIIINTMMIGQQFRKRKLSFWWVALLAVQIGLLLLCQATGAVLTLIAACVAFVFFMQTKIRFPLGIVYIVANMLFLFLMLTLMPLFSDLIISLGKDPTLTGRIPVWNRIISMMLEHHTLLGYGLGMFWRNPSAVRLITSGFDMKENPFLASLTTGAHNVILEMWLNNGILGIAAFFIMILAAFYYFNKMEEKDYRFALVILAYLTMNGLTERCLGGNYDYKTFISLYIMALGCNYMPSGRRKIRPFRLEEEKEKEESETAEVSEVSEVTEVSADGQSGSIKKQRN